MKHINIHTGLIVEIVNKEKVFSYPKYIKVYILDNGERISKELFFQHYRPIFEQ